MGYFRIVAASFLLIGSQVATAEPPRGAMPYGPGAGYGYAPMPYAPPPYAGGRYNQGPFGGGPFAGGPFGGSPFGGGPFNNNYRGGSGPFSGVPFMQSFDMSRPDSFNPMHPRVLGRGPGAWMNPTDPKNSLSNAWDDMMNAPARMGRVPPGWKAPTIDIPNPVDVADEFDKNARRAPTIMRENFTFN